MTSPTNEWVDEPSLSVLDRSTLEVWSTCPMQAGLIEAGKVIRESELLLTGIEVHDLLSRVTSEYVGSHGDYRPATLVDEFDAWAMGIRPDLTVETLQAIRPMLWSWAHFICDLHHDDILRFDGGHGDRSGQLAFDIEWLGVRITSELDLLYTGSSPKVLHEIDYKSGWRSWTADDVKSSFQFQLHPVLVFHAYPAVECLEITVWDTRTNHRTYEVPFYRRDLSIYETRIVKAVETWARESKLPSERRSTWPEADKCSACPVAQFCPRCVGMTTDPVELLRSLVVLDAAQANVKKQLAAIVKKTGQDVVTPEGDAFGKLKPPSKRAKPNALYSTKKSSTDDDEE